MHEVFEDCASGEGRRPGSFRLEGIHAAYVAIDAVINLEWTREAFAGKPDDFFCQPADIAEECYRIAHQPKSAWSFESVIRPFGETW